jgi:FKBP-type peptidyl-prolyl cis-trans isomerase
MRAVLTDPTKSEEEQFAVWRDAMPDNLSDDEVMDLMNKAKQRMAAIPPKKGAAPVAEDQVDELDVSKTLKFATKAHSKQKYGDKPYISHPRSVASTGKKFFGAAFTTDAIKVALLHDIVEDTPYKLEQLAKMGYAPEVVQAVELLTKNKNLSYADNIKAIIASGNKLAMMVKYADNYQNFTGDKSDWDADRAAHSQKKYLASLDMLGDVLGVKKHQSTESLNESVDPQASIIFDAYNPPDKDSIDGWKVAAKTKFWFVGTDKKRKDSKNPLPFDTKLVCMETAWPKVKSHIKVVTNLLELAAEAYKETGEIELFVCTNKEAEYKKVLQYNGHKGPHGYYDFERITRRAVPYYRHDKALKTALLDKDKEAFKQATGIDPEKKVVANHVRYEYYDLLEKFLIKRSLSETRLIELEETVRMSAAAKLQRAWDQQQAKSTASRKRGEEYMAQIKQDVANKNKKPDEQKNEQSVSELFEPSTDYYTLSNGKMVQVNYRPSTDGRSPTPFTDVKVSYVDPALKPQGSSFDSTGQAQRWDAAPDGVKQAIEKFVRQPQQDVAEKIKGTDGKACWKRYRYAGTKNGKDKCVPVSENIENKMASLIRLLENK